MRERTTICKRCGAEEEHGQQRGDNYYCSTYCYYEDNPDIVKKSKSAQERLKIGRKREAIKAKMRALKKEATEVGVPWV